MRKIIFAMLMLAPAYVHAADKCIQLDPSGSDVCSTIYTDYEYMADWAATCPKSTGIPVRGIGICAKTSGKMGDVMDDLEVSSNASENTCWCRLVSPAVSDWVFLGKSGTTDGCGYSCAFDCAFFTTYSCADCALFRRALFSNLKD